MADLQNTRDIFTSEASIMQSEEDEVKSCIRNCNGWLYRRFGQFLPETTPEEAEAIKADVKKNLAQNFNSTYGSPVTVQRYSEDAYDEATVQPPIL